MNAKANPPSEVQYTGIPVSEGVIIGKIFKLNSGPKSIQRYPVSKSEIPEEISRFENAILETRRELIEIQDRIAQAMGKDHASIFNAHLLLIEDFTIIKEVIRRIQNEQINAESIFSEVMNRFTRVFSEMEDEYLRERVADIKDVTRRVLKNLEGEKKQELPKLQERVIVLAYDLSPSETALMHSENVAGFATDIGGKTSHTAILARSLGIPAVVGLHDVSSRIPSNSKVILDGNRGLLIANPTDRTIRKYTDKKTVLEDYEQHLKTLRDVKAVTRDGRAIALHANIEMPEDMPAVRMHGAGGIGLYRTEYCYMNRMDLPSEDELTEMYTRIVSEMEGKPVVIRTMDIGGDKFLCHMQLPEEMNPFLGWRAIRFCLARKDIFKTQIRAILRAGSRGDTRILFPMISNVSEVIESRKILEECVRELERENKPHDASIRIGVMIEIPSAAIAADLLADHVDFFSIGTNDLIQYTLAVDRINEKIAYLYQPLHPAVIRLIENVVRVGADKSVEVHVCGEMSSDPASVLLMLGMGIDKLSLSPYSIPRIKELIRSVDYSHCRELTRRIDSCTTAEEIRRILEPELKNILPSFLLS